MEIINSHRFQLVAVSVLALCGFWPLIYDCLGGNSFALESGSTLRYSLQVGYLYKESSLVAIALVIPLFLDLVLDAKLFHLSDFLTDDSSNPQKGDMKCINFAEKAMLLVGFIITPCLSFISKEFSLLATLFICATRFQIVIICGTIWVSFCRYDSQTWNTKWMLVGMTTLTIGINLTAYAAILDDTRLSVDVLRFLFTNIPQLIFFCPSLYWIVKTFRALSVLSTKTHPQPADIGLSQSERRAMETAVFPWIYVTNATLAILVLAIGTALGQPIARGGLFPNRTSTGLTGIVLYMAGYVYCELMLVVFCIRQSKYDADHRLRALHDARKTYLRYMAHELRTPLQSSVLGLELLVGDLEEMCENEYADESDLERLETAHDVTNTLSTAVYILDQIMQLNGIENGDSMLHMNDFGVMSYVSNCMSVFAAEARSRAIHLEFADVTCAAQQVRLVNSHYR